MPKLSDLLAEKAKADIQVGGAKVEFTYYVMWRERFTDEKWGELMTPGLLPREQWKGLMPRVLTAWDIVDDEDHAIAVTAEAIDQHDIPNVLLSAIWTRIVGSELSGKVTTSNNSSNI